MTSALPPPVQDMVDGVAKAARPLDPVRTVLIGSTARREHSYGDLRGRTELYGDLEFYVMVRRPVPRHAEQSFLEAVRTIEDQAPYANPYFHIDVAVRDDRLFWKRLPLDLRLASMELVHSGEVIDGAPLPRDHPAARPARLDHGALREVALTRLWLQYLHFPIQCMDGQACPWERDILSLGLSRNLLDILTVMLPEQGVYAHGYTDRLEALRGDPSLAAPLGDDALDWQEDALHAKTRLELPDDPVALYEAFIHQSANLMLFLLGRGPTAQGRSVQAAVTALLKAPREFARPQAAARVRKLPAMARHMLTVSRSRGARRAWDLARAHRRNLMAALLLLEHRRLAAHLAGRPADVDPRAAKIVATLGGPDALPDDPVATYKTVAQVVAAARDGGDAARRAQPAITWTHHHDPPARRLDRRPSPRTR